MSVDPRPFVVSTVVTEPLNDPEQRRQMGLPDSDDEPMPVVVELNLRNSRGLPGAREQFERLYGAVVGDSGDRPPPELIANTYERCVLSVTEVRELVRRDAQLDLRERSIYRVWPDFPVEPLIYRSVSTVKGDAARRSFDATGRTITWAVIDSGIDGLHPHFDHYETLKGDVEHLHKDFTGGKAPLVDGFGHGTHVAGIIAGGLAQETAPGALKVVEHVGDEFGNIRLDDQTSQVVAERMAGVAPRCKLVSLKAMDDNGKGSSSNVLKALEYVREEINGNGKLLRIHGVNLSLGYEFLAEWFACGQSPLCVEVDRLVRSGVVVVAAAGNTGYGVLSTFKRQTKTGLALTINDPGNARLAITVGATHRDRPHTYGVSFFSSKGPTADGRPKPDLVAPGERITSCAAGKALQQIWNGPAPAGMASYVDDSGTSMAAPHVSGAIAAFLSVHQEYIGRPEEVKDVFLRSATSLDRESYFQGHGLVDLMRAIQSV